MKTFNEFINEDFNSAGATQFISNVTVRGRLFEVPIFYEKLPMRPFNLARYMKSFDSNTASTTLKNPLRGGGSWRGFSVIERSAIHMLVWAGLQLHFDVLTSLQNNHGKSAKLRYLDLYNEIYSMNPDRFTIKDTWGYPFIWENGAFVEPDWESGILDAMEDQKGLSKLFML
jgi:hypothetical protein